MSLLNNDFQKQELKFDIIKLREACDQVLKIKGFDTSLGIPHFAGISPVSYTHLTLPTKA